MDKKILGRIYSRLIHKYFLNDMYLDLRVRAKKDTVDYIEAHLSEAMLCAGRRPLLDLCLQRERQAGLNGLVLEFGVSAGGSIRQIAERVGARRTVHGFDSFVGLQEDWTGTHEQRGRYTVQGKLPRVPANVQLHKGWFNEVLPGFLAAHPGPVSFVNIDCDTYESSSYVLGELGDRIQEGTIIHFDEYYNYPNWREHEFKAWREFVTVRKLSYRYIGFSTSRYHAAVQVTKAG